MTGAKRNPYLVVYLDSQRIGDIARTATRAGQLIYAGTDVPPLSTAMPPAVRRYPWKTLGPWVDGLLPERPALLMQWRRQYGVTDLNPLSLLAHVGEDLAGATRLLRPERVDAAVSHGELIAQSEAEIATALRASQTARAPESSEGTEGYFSLAGAQPKIALHQNSAGEWFRPTGNTPTTHIIKPVTASAAGQELCEHLMMQTARAVGLSCASTALATFQDIPTVVVERYDRLRTGETVKRVHQEDFAQALGVYPYRKYQAQGGPSPVQIADHIRKHVPPAHAQEDVERFLQALIFNWLTVSTDAHAKNYSLLLNGAQARLAPLYDLNSFLALQDGSPHAPMAMRIGSTYFADDVTRSDWADVGVLLGVSEDWILAEIYRQAALLPTSLVEALVRLYDSGADVSGSPSRLAEGVATWCATALGNVFGS